MATAEARYECCTHCETSCPARAVSGRTDWHVAPCEWCGRTGPKDYDIDKVIEEARTAYWYLTPHVDCCPQCGREERYLAHKIPMGLKERE